MRLLVPALLLATGCAGYQPIAAPPQRLYAGETARIALPGPPTDSEVRWDPGDGTAVTWHPTAGEAAPELLHRWMVPGSYTVRAKGSGGEAAFPVEVLPRPPLRAIPADAEIGLALRWESLGELRPFFFRIFDLFGSRAKDVLFQLGRIAALRDADLKAQGFDPAEGIAVVQVPGDYSPWILLGTLDEALADSTARRLLEVQGPATEIPLGEALPQGARLWSAIGSRGYRVSWGHIGGYLALQVGWSQESAPAAFTTLASAEKTPLGDFDPYVRAQPLAGSGDLQGWVALGPYTNGAIDGAALAADGSSDELDLHFGVALSREQVARYAPAFRTTTRRPAGIFSFPAGAGAVLALSVEPRAFYRLFLTDPDERDLVEDVAAAAHVQADELLRRFTGHASASFFVHADLLDTLNDTPQMVVKAELAGGSEVQEFVRGIVPALEARADPGDEPILAEVAAGHLAVTRRDLGPMLSQPGDRAIAEAIGSELLADPSEQILYVDLRAALPALGPVVKNGEPEVLLPGLDESLGALRDLTLHGALTEGGISGGLRIRLMPSGT